MYRIPPKRMTSPKHIRVVHHINPNKPTTVYVGPIQRTDKDHWKLENCHLVRVHRTWRKALFEPLEQREMPTFSEKLLGQRTTTIEYEDGHMETINDDWLTSLNPTRCAPRKLWWRNDKISTHISHGWTDHTKTTHEYNFSKPQNTRSTMDSIHIGTRTRLLGKRARDYWENVHGKWKRHHVRPRSRFYGPGAEQQPSEQGPPETLVRGRRTIMGGETSRWLDQRRRWVRERNSKMDKYHWVFQPQWRPKYFRKNSGDNSQWVWTTPRNTTNFPVPRQPSQHEREKHELTHLPFRAWCKTCVVAKARQAYHTKQPDRRDCLQLDFGFLTEGN